VKRNDDLERAFDELGREVPDAVTRTILWMRSPRARWVRIPLGLVCIAGSVFWFLPVLGLWFLPVGLLLIAQDVRPLRRPVGRMTLWLLRQWKRLRGWWRERRARG
jgi:hypothetical protein